MYLTPEQAYEKWQGTMITLNDKGLPEIILTPITENEDGSYRTINQPHSREILQALLFIENEPIVISKV